MNATAINPFLSFLTLKKKYPRAFFFESVDMSLIGLDADEVIRLVAGKVEVTKGNKVEQHDTDFLDYLNQKSLEFKSEVPEFPFAHGGLFGCVGYEVVALMENKLQKSGYFSKINSSEEVLAEVFLSHNVIVFLHKKNVVHFALRDFKLSEADLVKGAETLEKLPMVDVDLSLFAAYLGKETYLKGVAELKAHIKAGNIFQAVLSDRFERKCHTSSLDYFTAMKRFCPSAYNFYFDLKESSFFGTSPEALLKIEDQILETHPIAGTRPRGSDAAEDKVLEAELLASAKEGAEHLMLVDLARNDIGRIAKPGSVKVEGYRTLLNLPNVMHLVSVVTGKKREDRTDLDAFAACFPAGTLTGAPKIRAMEILSEIETRPRGFYGGAVIALDFSGGLESCISIRSVEMKKQTAILRAGAGIVADSDPMAEYQEIQHKLKSLMQILEMMEKEYL